MAKFDYVDAKNTAKTLIDEFGASGSFTSPEANGGIDPATGDISAATPVVKTGVVTPVLNYKASEIDGTSVLNGDGYAFFYGTAPSIGDVHVQNGETWRVVSVSGLMSVEGVEVYIQVQLRK